MAEQPTLPPPDKTDDEIAGSEAPLLDHLRQDPRDNAVANQHHIRVLCAIRLVPRFVPLHRLVLFL